MLGKLRKLVGSANKNAIIQKINELIEAVARASNIRLVGGGRVNQTPFGMTIQTNRSNPATAVTENITMIFAIESNETAGGFYKCYWQEYDDTAFNTQNLGSLTDRSRVVTGSSDVSFMKNTSEKDYISYTGSTDLRDRYVKGMSVIVTSSASNNATFKIHSVTSGRITLTADETLVTEADTSATLTAEAIILNVHEVPVSGDATSHLLSQNDFLRVCIIDGDESYPRLFATDWIRYTDCS